MVVNKYTSKTSDDISTFGNQNKIVSDLSVVDKRRLLDKIVSLGHRITKCISNQYHYKSFKKNNNNVVHYWPRRTPASHPSDNRQTTLTHITIDVCALIQSKQAAVANHGQSERAIGRPTAVPHRRRLCPLVCRRRCPVRSRRGTNRPKTDCLPQRRTVYDNVFVRPSSKT